MPNHTHSPKTCRKLNCKYMEQDFIKSLNKPEIIKDSYRLIKQLDKQVNKLLVEHAFRNQVQGDEGMKKKLKIILLENAHLPMNVQKENLDIYLQDWKGEEDQIVDVTIFGIKI